MKALLIAAGVLLIPAAASAQVAAGSVPNTFDRKPATAAQTAPATATPAQNPPAQTAPAVTAPATTPAIPAPTEPANAEAADTLRGFIAAVQADQIDYAVFTDDLAAKIREQAPQVTSIIKGFGAVQAVDFMGSREGADLFAVTFASAETQWVIGFDEAGKVAALLFRPAQPSGAPAAPPPAASPAPKAD